MKHTISGTRMRKLCFGYLEQVSQTFVQHSQARNIDHDDLAGSGKTILR